MKKMFDNFEKEIEKAVVFCPIERGEDKDFQFAEIERLCSSANLQVLKIFHQDIKALNRRTIIGTGKLDEIKNFVKENDVDVLVVDFKLTGSQLKNLSDFLGVKVLDRILLIIDIFACNAKSNEGKMEVKLAQNRYLLTKDEIYVEDKLFATLETTSRRMFLGENKFCILTDTVGFISKLPHELVESFASTLEEIRGADLILHVVDVSDKNYKKNIEITNQILDEIGATKNRIVVLNKVDLLKTPFEIAENEIPFSVKKRTNLEKLKNIIRENLFGD